MGRRGPPPKPTAIRLLHGNPGKRPLNTREPRPRPGVPRCPPHLSPEARRVWRRLAHDLKRMGVLTLVDADAIEVYCRTYVRWKAAEDFLEQHGEIYSIRDDRGRIKCMAQFPQVAVARHLVLILKGYQQEFGLTPASRTRLQIPWPDERKPWDGVTDRLGRPC